MPTRPTRPLRRFLFARPLTPATRPPLVATGPSLLAALTLLLLPVAGGCGDSGARPDGGREDGGGRDRDVAPGDGPGDVASDIPVEPSVIARFDPNRPEHYFDVPYPSDALLGPEGTPILGRFPEGSGVGSLLVQSYIRRHREAVFGFGLNTPIYFAFSGQLELLATTVTAVPEPTTKAPVLLIDLGDGREGGKPALHPLEHKYLPTAGGDPFLPEHALLVAPLAGAPLRGGARYAAVITRALRAVDGTPVGRAPAFAAGFPPTAAAGAPPVVSHQERLLEALDALGIDPADVVAATAFTTQDVHAQRLLIREAVDAALDADPATYQTLTELREVRRLTYTQGMTPSGRDATVATVDYADGGQDRWHMFTEPGQPPHVVELDETWPFRVYEGRLNTASLQGPADKPFASPGFGVITDAGLDTGRINFQRTAKGALELVSQPEPEPMRVLIQVPRTLGTELASCRAFVWDHGTGGSAYNAVSRILADDSGPLVAGIISSRGYCLISRDQPLYGKRFDLIDGGYDVYLAVYNVANLTAFRDNLRQASIDGYVLERFVQERLGTALAKAGVIDDPSRIDPTASVKFGHSLGSVTSHLVLAQLLDPPAGRRPYRAAFMSGSGGLLTLFFTEAGLGANVDAATLKNARTTLKGLGVELGEGELTASRLIGALAGIPEPVRETNIDRLHPIMALFQTIMDPADPINYAPRLEGTETILLGVGDRQVPNAATYALAEALPSETVIPCETTSDYDPHSCMFREVHGRAALDDFLANLAAME